MSAELERLNKDFKALSVQDKIKAMQGGKDQRQSPFSVGGMPKELTARFDNIEDRLVKLNRKMDQLISITRGY